MAKQWNRNITQAERLSANAGCKSVGTNDTDNETLGGYLGFAKSTIKLWFQPNVRSAPVLRLHVGTAICAYVGDEQVLGRLLTAFLIGYPGGLSRIPLYTGKTYIYEWFADDLGEIVRHAVAFVQGDFDAVPGFRLSKAWTSLKLKREADDSWTFTATYKTFGQEDDSDPAEPCPEEGG